MYQWRIIHGPPGFPIDAEVEVFTHKNRKMMYKIKIYASMWRTVLCTYFLVLSDRSAVSTSSRRKGKRSSTGIKVFCVVSLDNYEHAQTVNPYSCDWLSKTKKWLPFFKVKSHFDSCFWNPQGTLVPFIQYIIFMLWPWQYKHKDTPAQDNLLTLVLTVLFNSCRAFVHALKAWRYNGDNEIVEHSSLIFLCMVLYI